jgi:hypothetical protein
MKKITILILIFSTILRGYGQITKTSATSLLRPASTNGTVLTTNSSGAIEWTTYSNLASLLGSGGGSVTGTGTTNTIAIFTGTNAVGNSKLVYDGVEKITFDVGATSPTIDLKTTGTYAKMQIGNNYIQMYKGTAFQYNITGTNIKHSFLLDNVEKVAINTNGLGTISGSAANPSRYFLSSTNTGDYFDGGYAITVLGTKRLGISGTGNLGINSTNVFIGTSGNEILGGSYQNVGVGNTLTALNGGNFNGAMGYFSLGQLTTGSSNFAMGAYSQYGNIAGSNNVSLGTYSLINVTGSSNIGVGTSAGGALTSGNNNTAIGGNSLSTTTIGTNNTSIGMTSGGGNPTGSNNISIGYQAGYDTGTPNSISNAIYIGTMMPNDGISNGMYIGNSSNNLMSWKGKTYNWDLPESSLNSTHDGRVWTFNNAAGKLQLLAPNTLANNNQTLIAQRIIALGANDLLFTASTGKILFGSPSIAAKFSGENVTNGLTAFNFKGVSANVNIDFNGTGINNLDGGSTNFRTYAGSPYAAFSSSGLDMTGKSISNLPTTGQTNNQAISVAQADATYAKIFAKGETAAISATVTANSIYTLDVTVTGISQTDAIIVNSVVNGATPIKLTASYFTTNTMRLAFWNTSDSDWSIIGGHKVYYTIIR